MKKNDDYEEKVFISKKIRFSIDANEDENDEEIIFIHNFFRYRKFEYLEKNNKPCLFNNLIKNEFKNNTIINRNEIKIIEIEQTLSNLNVKISKFLSYKDEEFNCTFMENLYSYAEQIGFENTVGYLFPLLKELQYNNSIKPKIITSFFINFNKLQNFLLNEEHKEKGYKIIINDIVPLIECIFRFRKNEDLLKEASNSLKLIIKKSNNEDKCSKLIPLLILLSQDSNINNQILSINIFNSITEEIGQLLTESFIIPQFIAFSEDSKSEIRLCLINNFINVCNIISYNCLITKILPIYLILSKDENWEIRKKSIQILPSLCKICKSNSISNSLINVFFFGINDNVINVKNTCLEIFGEFIYYLKKEDLEKNKQMINVYVNETLEINISLENNLTLIYNIAYSFPSVLITLKEKISNEIWDEIKIVYFYFFNVNDFKVKLTISSSFKEISKIIGSDKSEKDIAPQILLLFEKNGKDIKNNIIYNLPEYLLSIKNKDVKNQFLKCFNLNRNNNWREQIKYVQSLGNLINVYDIDILEKKIFPKILELCFNKFNKVRKKSIKELSKYLFKYFNDNEDYKNKALIILESFANCIHYHYRQLFVYLIFQFFIKENLFMEIIYPLFYNLSFDKIDNVRISEAKMLNKILKQQNENYKWVLNNKKMLEIIFRFQNDESNEVKNYMKDIKIKEDFSNIKFANDKMKFINESFTNKMEIIYDMYNIHSIYLGVNWLKNK